MPGGPLIPYPTDITLKEQNSTNHVADDGELEGRRKEESFPHRKWQLRPQGPCKDHLPGATSAVQQGEEKLCLWLC